MNSDELSKELRRQRRANYVQSWLIFLLVVAGICYFSSQVNNLKQQVKLLSSTQAKPIDVINGSDGQDGIDGINGWDGDDGRNGKDVTPELIAAAVSQYLAENPPPPGPQGLTGEPGKDGTNGEDAVVFDVRLDTTTCTLQKKLSTDTFWLDVAQYNPLACLSGGL